MTDQQSMINIENITKQLEPMIRRIIREELANVIKDVPGLFYLNPGMPLHNDMEELRKKKADGRIKFHSHNEVWGE